jgi:DNA (cytosine-5)-methyltransferase 1
MAPTFIDLFSGCGGLSLGLKISGWKGLFAIEKNSDAFETLWHNFNQKENLSFYWGVVINYRQHLMCRHRLPQRV